MCVFPSVAGGCVQSCVQKPKEQTPAELLHDRTPTGNVQPLLLPLHMHTVCFYMLYLAVMSMTFEPLQIMFASVPTAGSCITSRRLA